MNKPKKLVLSRNDLPLIVEVVGEDGKVYDFGMMDNKNAKSPRIRTSKVQEVIDYFKNLCFKK